MGTWVVYLVTELGKGVSMDTGVAYPRSEGSSASYAYSSASSRPECHHAMHHSLMPPKKVAGFFGSPLVPIWNEMLENSRFS